MTKAMDCASKGVSLDGGGEHVIKNVLILIVSDAIRTEVKHVYRAVSANLVRLVTNCVVRAVKQKQMNKPVRK